MLSIDHTETTQAAGRTPLLRRISEIMHEKGEGFTARALSQRIGINRETFRLMLVGERPISPATLEKIAAGLGLSVERLRQMDTFEMEQNLSVILDGKRITKTMLKRASDIAEELVKVAIGVTERGYALHSLGRVLYFQEKYDAAHQTWLTALDYATQLKEYYGDSTLLHQISSNLMLTFSIRKEYSQIDELLSLVEQSFPSDPDKLGKVYFTRMMVQKDRGNLEEAKKFSYRSLAHFEQTHDDRQIGHALINVAHFEYRLGNFKTSARALASAIKLVENHEDILVIAVKEYIKSLLKLRDYETASRIEKQYEAITRNYPEYWAKIQIMRTVLKDDPTYADRICNDPSISLSVRASACNCLFQYFAKKDDAERAMSYYKKGRVFSSSKTEFFEQEGF